MPCSFQLFNYSYITRFNFRSKTCSQILLYNRKYCTKDNKTSDETAMLKKKLSKENSTKIAENSPEKMKFSNESKEAAKQKLKSLLAEITVSSDVPSRTSNLNLAKPLKRAPKKERFRILQDQQITPEKEMNIAVKAVASSFKEDADKIQTELTEKLNSLDMSNTNQTVAEEKVNVDSEADSKINENIMSSVKEVAATISESPIPSRSELTQRLLKMSLEKEIPPGRKKSVMSIIGKMKLEAQNSVSLKAVQKKEPIKRPQINLRKIDLFGSTPLNIFKLDSNTKTDAGNMFWQKLEQKELRLLTQFAPANGFEEMIMWTDEGKHWKFPIDNEIEMGAEEKVGFHEHVFLDHHLKGFPTRGPIRHFMELVIVGLSKNPYITVERKIENIEWFRNYFKEKEDILKDAGALE